MEQFKLHSKFKPTGDQPQAIEKLARGVLDGMKEQTLMGVTGSGKTFTMANIIERVNRPTLVLAHNKTLAAQLSGILSGKCGGVFCFLLRLLSAGGLRAHNGHLY